MFCRHCGKQLPDQARFCNGCGNPVAPAATAAPAATPPVAATPASAPPAGSASGQAAAPYPPGPLPPGPTPQYSAPPPQYSGQPQYGAPYQPAASIPPVRSRSGLPVLWLVLLVLTFLGFGFFAFRSGLPLAGWLVAAVVFVVSLFLVLVPGKKHLAAGLSGWAIPTFLAVVVLVANGIGILPWGGGPGVPTGQPTGQPTQVATPDPNAPIGEDSSAVSRGVSLDDLGNIMNGQYFFDDGQAEYYSSFDTAYQAHIYRRDKATGTATPLFDGFGWSLVVHKGWLYFSGNQGTAIDGTYNLFRIRTDGTQLEKLNSVFCYGMSFYQEWLYYIRKADFNATTSTLCRAKLDGTGEEELVLSAGGFCIVYENRLYYTDANGAILSARTDGRDPVSLVAGPVSFFSIGNGKLVYVDASGAIRTANPDGSGQAVVRAYPGGRKTLNVNSRGDVLYFASYDETALPGRYAYAYTLSSIRMDGTDEKALYEGVSYGFYINVLDDRIFVLDYAIDPDSGQMPAIARQMRLDGSQVEDLPR